MDAIDTADTALAVAHNDCMPMRARRTTVPFDEAIEATRTGESALRVAERMAARRLADAAG